MPQLDLIIIIPQIFWLLVIFFFTYTALTHFFLPFFVKSLKTRQRIVAKNSEMLVLTQKKFDEKQIQLNSIVNKNFYLIKLFLEVEVSNIFSKELMLNLNMLDAKIVESLYYNIVYYDVNVLNSVLLSPKFLNLNFKN